MRFFLFDAGLSTTEFGLFLHVGFHFQCLDVGISYLEKEEVRVLLRQVSFKHFTVVERPFSLCYVLVLIFWLFMIIKFFLLSI